MSKIASFQRTVSICTFLLLFTAMHLAAQNNINGGIESKDTASLSVIRIFPDSFPRVSVLFRATTPNGQPIWNVNKDNVSVKEDGQDCAVISVKKVSEDSRVNTALVIDHSGSMLDNPNFYRWSDSVSKLPKRWTKTTLREYSKGKVNSDSVIMISVTPTCPPQYQPAMFHAKMAAQAYISSIDSSKDQTSLIGFSESITARLPLSRNRTAQRAAIDSMRATGSTAFFDAVYAALDDVNKGNGIKAVVAMTDGDDNASKHTLAQVIAHAKELEIPVYVVGVGNANKKVLRKLAKQTGGESFFTSDPSKLTSIYLSISGKIKSIYELVYESPSLASVDSTREIELTFEIGDEFLRTRKLNVVLPSEVIQLLEEKEKAAAALAKTQQVQPAIQQTPQSEDPSNWPYAAGVIVLAAGAGLLTARYYKEKKKGKGNVFEITSIYPNPSVGPITILVSTDVAGMPGNVVVTDATGAQVFVTPFGGGSAIDIDLSFLNNGVYYVSVQAGGNTTLASPVSLIR